uniref:Ig-like domain-containing protein n=1 Tax=Lachnospira sp. TaxID=2049031 RepID=UPI003FEFE8CE
MKKGLAKRILVSLLTVVMISASVLPMLVSTANVARANENVTNVLTEGVEIDTPNVVKDETYSDYVKVTFIVNDTETIVKYVKTGDTVTVRSTNSSVGVLVGDAPNGSAVTEDTTIYVKTYNYKDVLNIKKELVNEYGEPDADGYYTLKFTAGAKNMPSIHSATRNDMVLVIDASLSMACSVKGSRATDGNEYMADTYADTRFKAMYNAVDSFLNAFLPEGNDKNTISLVIYNVSALDQLNAIYKKSSTTKKSEVMAALDAVFNEAAFNESFANSPKNEYGVNVDKMTNPGSLASKTNVKAGLDVAADIFVANNNTNAKSIILFTDGVANRPNTAVTTESMTQYAVGGTYTYNETDYTISDIAYKTSYYNENNEEIKDNKNQIAAAYYASQKGQELAKDNVSIYSFALIDSVTDNVRAAMGDTNLDVSEYVSSASPVKKTTNIKLQISPKFTYTESGTGYAKKFFATTNVDELNKEFKSIIASLKELPFDTATVTDTLDEHFELVPGQTGVTDNGNGTFTVTYPNKITTDAQEITVKIKAKDGYAGSSYTNAGCTFNATVGDLTYSQNFAEEPSAVITPDAVNDSYTVNQGETLTVADVSVLDNDNNIKVNNPDKNVTIKAEKVTDPQNGTITFNEDGTFTYTPNNGFSGEDTFRYKTVLTVDGRTYEKEATVTITVVPKYTQTIKYVLENGTKAAEDNVQTVVKGNSTTAVTSPSIPGYKPSIEVVEATQLTGDKEIIVKYVRDDEQTKNVTYTVEYYKDNVKDDTKTQSYTNPIWVNDNEQNVKLSEINTTDKFGAGYKFEKTDPATIPATIADKGVIKVYYVAKEFKYTVKYVLEGTDTELTAGYTKSATFGTEVGADKKNIEGYTVVDADKKLTIGSDESQNVLVIEYRANTYGYSVEYYYDGVKDESATLNKSAQFNIKVDTYDPKEKPGYKFEKTESCPLTITTDASKNIIKVYYVKDENQKKDVTYTVKYFKDGVEVTADEQKVTKQIWVNDTKVTVEKSDINTTDKYEGFSFDADTTGVIPDTIGNDGVIRVYYVSNYYNYTVEYYYDDVIDNAKTDTFPAKYNTQVNRYDDKNIEGYKLERATTPITITTDASKNVIRVYYVKDWFKYTINYYYDGVIDTSATVVDKAAFGTTIKYSDKMDKLREGFKFVRADGSPLVISVNEAANVINVHYQSNSYTYTVEYYYDGIIDTEKTEKSATKYNSVVNDYTDKCDTGYKFEKVEGLPLTIATDESKNVIRVYYVKDESQKKNVTYTVKYFKDGTEVTEDQQTKTDTVWVNASSNMTVDKTAINTTDKYVGYKLDTSATGTIPDTVTDGDVINVYYVKDTSQTRGVSYTVEYYKDGVKDDSKTDVIPNDIWVNDDVQPVDATKINVTDKFGAGYKFEKTDPATIPSTIADKGVIKVYYVAKEFKYTVKYVLEGTDTELTAGYTKSATFGTEVGADKKNIEGYTVVDADKKLTIGSDESQNVLVIEYRANTYGYSVEYYYDGVKDESATLNKSAQFNTKVNSYDPGEKPGYKFEKTENLPLTITTDASKNVIKVYYVKDASQTKNITYTVKYFKDGAEVTADKQTVTKTVWVNDPSELTVDKTAINTTDKYVGYKLDSAATGEIPTVVADGTVINVYYVKDELQTKEVTYTVKYFRDGVEVTADKQTVTKRIWINAPLEVEVNKTAINTTDKYVGYKLDSAATGEIPSVVASGTVINVYYVKDASQTKDVTYTIKYYKDGEEQTEDTITVTKKVWVNEPSVIDVNKADINTTDKYEGYTFDSETTGIIPNKADNGSVIKVYYKKVVVPAEPSSDNSQETVKTGDNSNMMLYILMLATCVAGAATVVVTGRKKSEQE